MGNAARLRKKQKNLEKYLDDKVTLTRRAQVELIEREANKKYNDMKKNLSDEISKGIAASAGYILASALEQEHGFGKKRCGKAVMAFMTLLVDLTTHRIEVEDHMEYWNNKGLKITENKDGTMTVLVD